MVAVFAAPAGPVSTSILCGTRLSMMSCRLERHLHDTFLTFLSDLLQKLPEATFVHLQLFFYEQPARPKMIVLVAHSTVAG